MKKRRLPAALLVLALTASAASASSGARQLTAYYRDIQLVVDGETVVPHDVNGEPAEPFIVDGTVYLPLRAIGEALDMTVAWDEDTSTAHVDANRGEVREVTVSTASELVAAIGPDTHITLKSGVYDLSTADYAGNPYAGGPNAQALTIAGVRGLTLEGEGEVELVTPNRSVEVLRFLNCSKITLKKLKAGHSVTGDYACDAGVLSFGNTQNIHIEDCYLYGSGAEGINLYRADSVYVTDTVITDCSLRAAYLSDSRNVTFTRCKLIDNRAYGNVLALHLSQLALTDCDISDNHNLTWNLIELSASELTIDACRLTDNANPKETLLAMIVTDNPDSVSLRDSTLELRGFTYYCENDFLDLGGNTFEYELTK